MARHAQRARQPKVLKAPIYGEVGRTGLNQLGGVIYEEFLPQLQGEKAYKVFREMRDNDPIVGAVLFAIEMYLRKVPWHAEGENDEQTEFLESCIGDMSQSWEDIIASIAGFLPFGFSAHEIVYKIRQGDNKDTGKSSRYDDNRIAWRKFPERSQDTVSKWVFDEEGGIRALVQKPPPDYLERTIPIEKLLLFRAGNVKGSPEGKSVLRNAYRPFYLKKHLEEIEALGAERDLAGLPLLWVPAEITLSNALPEHQALYADLKEIVVNIRRDEQEGLILPLSYDEVTKEPLYKFELVSASGSRQFDTNKIIERYNRNIAMTVLADFIMIGHEATGSFALADVKGRMFTQGISAWLKMIAAVLNRHAVPRLWRLNGFPLDDMPELIPGEVEEVNLKDLGEFIAKLAGSGMALFPDDELENQLRGFAKMPPKPPELSEASQTRLERELEAPPPGQQVAGEDEEDDEKPPREKR